MSGRQAEVKILQEMGFTGTIVAVNPDTSVADLTGTNGVQDMIQTVKDFVCKDILLNFNLNG